MNLSHFVFEMLLGGGFLLLPVFNKIRKFLIVPAVVVVGLDGGEKDVLEATVEGPHLQILLPVLRSPARNHISAAMAQNPHVYLLPLLPYHLTCLNLPEIDREVVNLYLKL